MRLTAITKYKIISLFCCVVLSGVQTFLIYNTFKLENERYVLAEKEILNEEYSRSVSNDKLFPGGEQIIDQFIYANMPQLEYNYRHNATVFEVLRQNVCDSIFSTLRQKNNLDSIVESIIKKRKLRNNFVYAATINTLDVAFELNNYVPLFIGNKNAHTEVVNGAEIIGGTLKNISKQNLISRFTVSTPLAHTYRVAFSLYMDSPNREMAIIKRMLPTLILSIAAIIAVVILFYTTFRNWVKQKKIADMQSDFVNNITHEFHTPLAAIMVANKNIQLDKIIEDKNKIKPLTEVIKRQSERLQHLINQVIDITQINHQQLKFQDLSLTVVLNNIIADYQLKITDPKIQITLQTNASNDMVKLDVFWFTTLMTNLLDNAIKYNINASKKIAVATQTEGSNILLTITDNGVGIKQEMLQNIFNKFYRAPDTINRNEGLGLGLYFVKTAIEAHNWTIQVSSEPDQGTNFSIRIT
jgi:two-component system phosphate regulon sensor histidine kinase PhoR